MSLLADRATVPMPDAAALLGISRSAAYAAVKAGTFPVPVIHIGSRIVVPTAPLRRLLDPNPAGPSGVDAPAPATGEAAA